MMDYLAVLAQAVDSAGSNTEHAVVPVEQLWDYIISVNRLEALTFVSFGAVCLLYGWRVFKILVVICFSLIGMSLGVMAADAILGEQSQLWGGLGGVLLFAALSVPLMRWAVSVLGAISGGVLTAGLWYAFNLSETYIWAGALVGLIAGGMISFIVFKVAVMLFSSLGGSILMAIGTLALLYRYAETQSQLYELVFDNNWFLPVVFLVPTIVGVIMQNKFIKSSKDWEV
jgi:hypothetical protein